MKMIRLAGIVVSIGLLLLAILAGVLYAMFDGEKIKVELSRAVFAKTQRELTITGPAQLSLWPNVGVKLGRTTLSEPASPREFLALDSARIAVAVMPLLAKKLVVNDLQADGLTATLVKRKDGSLNIADLSSSKPEDKKVGAGDTALQLDVSGIALTNAHLVWRDEQAGSTTTLAKLNITTGPVLADGQKQTLTVDAVTLKDVEFNRRDENTGNTMALAGLSFSADHVAVNSGLKTLVVDAVNLKNKQFSQRDGKTGKTTRLDDLSFSAAHVAADSGRQTLAVDNVALTTRGKQGSNAFDIDLAAPQLTVTPGKVAGKTISLNAKLSGGGRQTTAKIALSGMEGTLTDVKVSRMLLDADSTSGATALKIHLASPLSANITAQTVTLQKIAGTVDVKNPAMPMKQVSLPLNGSAQVDVKKQRAAIRLATQFDESKVFFESQIERFSPLALGFDLTIDRLNVDKYFPPKPAVAVSSTGATGQASAGDAPLNFSALRGLNLHGVARIGSLQVKNLKFSQLNATLKAANGRLDIAPLSANLYEGSMSGSLAVNANGNGVAVRQKLVGVSVAPLLKDLANKDLIAGKGVVTVDVTGQGASVSALKKSLAGSASLVLRDGAIKGINLAQSMRDIQSKLGARQDVTQVSRGADKTDFSEFSASFRLTGGVAHNEDLAIKSPFLRLSGAGDIDIGNNRINYLAKVRVVNTSAGQDGKEADQVKGVTVPVRVTGPLDKITWKIEFASAIGDLLKEKAQVRIDEKKQELQKKVDEKKQEIQQKATDQLKEKLKGIFGR
ncbi:MAG: AsmA family protein [Rugosibacter sp.]|jgi:AsmA protein|nr:AsmA family protein [Rugosibacter sp.]MDO9272357.1 AsmA family protein [Rugosibacter sp.]